MTPASQRTSTANAVANPSRKLSGPALPLHLWCCRHFLTVILFVAMLPTLLAHCLFRGVYPAFQRGYTAKEPSQHKHSNKKTLHSNHHHRSAYASIKIGGSILKHNAVLCVRFAQPPHAYASIPTQWLSHKSPLC